MPLCLSPPQRWERPEGTDRPEQYSVSPAASSDPASTRAEQTECSGASRRVTLGVSHPVATNAFPNGMIRAAQQPLYKESQSYKLTETRGGHLGAFHNVGLGENAPTE